MIATDIFGTMESLTNDQIYSLLKPIYSKIEALAGILKVDLNVVDGIKQVLHYALVVYSLWMESKDDLEGRGIKKSCIDLLKRITTHTRTDTENALSLSRSIAEEFITKIKSARSD